nr:hypothetical protein [Oceanococcus sp. HetDA_MAG_MS8]
MPEQSRLLLESGRKLRLDNFLSTANPGVIGALRDWLASEQADICLILGPAGCGKSHLLQGCAAAWAEQDRPWRYVPAAVQPIPQASECAGGLLVLDGLEALPQEQALPLMRAIDDARQGRWRILLSSRLPVSQLSLPVEDLRSRLQWGVSLSVRPLDDAGLSELLQQQAQELGVHWAQRNTDYVLRRLPRSPGVLLAVQAKAVDEAIRQQRQLGLPLLGDLLASSQLATAIQQTASEP